MASKFLKKNQWIVTLLLKAYTHTQKFFTHILEINNKNLTPCIYAMWHSDQFCVFGMPDKDKISILISKSFDGGIVADVSVSMGFKVVRGSSSKSGAVEATMKMIELLKAGEHVAVTVDGPHGPLHKVKNGVIKLAQKSGAPIVPVCWYSAQKSFIKFPSWDRMSTPLGDTKIINLYGDPIYIPEDLTHDQFEEYRLKVENAMLEVWNRLPEEFEKAKQQKLWDKKK